MSLQEKINNIASQEESVRGEIILKAMDFIKRERGKVGFEKIKNTLKDLEIKPDPEKIDSLDWVNGSVLTAILLLSKDIFEWTDRDIVEMGIYTPKNSVMNKFFIDHFTSLESFSKVIDNYWKKVSTAGQMEITDKNKKELIVTLSDYDYDPLNCLFISGLLQTVFSLSHQGFPQIKEKKCIHQGDSVHQFLISW